MKIRSQKEKCTNSNKPLTNATPKVNVVESMETNSNLHFDEKIERALKIVRNGSKNVHLNNMDINDDIMGPLCEELSKYKQLECIYLYINRIGAKGIKNLVELMKSLQSVKYLHLGGNHIGDEGLKEIAKFIKDDNVLEHLAVGNVFSCNPEHGSSVTNDGIITLADAIVGNTSLKILGLGGKKRVTDGSVPALRHMLQNCCVNHIDLMGTGISESFQGELCRLAERPYEEREIGKVLGLEKLPVSYEILSDSSIEESKASKNKHFNNKKAKSARDEDEEDAEEQSRRKKLKKSKISTKSKKIKSKVAVLAPPLIETKPSKTNGKKKPPLKMEIPSRRLTRHSTKII